jgi:hypothetical protein
MVLIQNRDFKQLILLLDFECVAWKNHAKQRTRVQKWTKFGSSIAEASSSTLSIQIEKKDGSKINIVYQKF